jgi:cephalosporin hydroxylase
MNLTEIKNKLSCSTKNCFENDYFDINFRNGVVNHVSYNGLSIEQNPNIVDRFNDLIKLHKPSRVLEIGTFHGGLTEIIRDLLDLNNLKDSELISYDVSIPEFTKKRLEKKRISLIVKNLFLIDYSDFFDNQCMNELKEYIQLKGTTLVLCDGGSKKNEFRLISKLLKTGDIIMAHDYSPNEEYFEKKMKNNFWNWMEIQDSDIDGTNIKYNLTPLKETSFLEVGWVCKIKN